MPVKRTAGLPLEVFKDLFSRWFTQRAQKLDRLSLGHVTAGAHLECGIEEKVHLVSSRLVVPREGASTYAADLALYPAVGSGMLTGEFRAVDPCDLMATLPSEYDAFIYDIACTIMGQAPEEAGLPLDYCAEVLYPAYMPPEGGRSRTELSPAFFNRPVAKLSLPSVLDGPMVHEAEVAVDYFLDDIVEVFRQVPEALDEMTPGACRELARAVGLDPTSISDPVAIRVEYPDTGKDDLPVTRRVTLRVDGEGERISMIDTDTFELISDNLIAWNEIRLWYNHIALDGNSYIEYVSKDSLVNIDGARETLHADRQRVMSTLYPAIDERCAQMHLTSNHRSSVYKHAVDRAAEMVEASQAAENSVELDLPPSTHPTLSLSDSPAGVTENVNRLFDVLEKETVTEEPLVTGLHDSIPFGFEAVYDTVVNWYSGVSAAEEAAPGGRIGREGFWSTDEASLWKTMSNPAQDPAEAVLRCACIVSDIGSRFHERDLESIAKDVACPFEPARPRTYELYRAHEEAMQMPTDPSDGGGH